MEKPFIANMLEAVAPLIGAKVVFEKDFQYVGYIDFGQGMRSFFRNTNFGVNPLGSTEIARDKTYASYFLNEFLEKRGRSN